MTSAVLPTSHFAQLWFPSCKCQEGRGKKKIKGVLYLPLTDDLEVVLDALVVDVVALALLNDGHLNLLVEERRRDLGSLLGDGGGIAAVEGDLGGRPEGRRSECSKRKHDDTSDPCSHSMKKCGGEIKMVVVEGTREATMRMRTSRNRDAERAEADRQTDRRTKQSTNQPANEGRGN